MFFNLLILQPPEIKIGELIIALTAAFLGAIIGGVCTYFSSIYFEHRKQNDLIRRLHCILLFEILDHQASLQRTLDNILPYWLLRNEINIYGKYIFIDLLKTPPSILRVSYFSTFLDELSYSPKIVSIANYYEHVKITNRLAEKWRKNPNTEIKERYIYNCVGLLEAALFAIEDLLKTKQIEKHFTELLKNNINEYNLSIKRCEMQIAISKTNYSKLSRFVDYERAKLTEKENPELSKKLGLQPDYQQDPYVMEIPELIRNDPDKLWREYFEDAQEIVNPRIRASLR